MRYVSPECRAIPPGLGWQIPSTSTSSRTSTIGDRLGARRSEQASRREKQGFSPSTSNNRFRSFNRTRNPPLASEARFCDSAQPMRVPPQAISFDCSIVRPPKSPRALRVLPAMSLSPIRGAKAESFQFLLTPTPCVGRSRNASSPAGRSSARAAGRRTCLSTALSKDGVRICVVHFCGRCSTTLTRSKAGHQQDRDRTERQFNLLSHGEYFLPKSGM
jgi:hypothetical protein